MNFSSLTTATANAAQVNCTADAGYTNCVRFTYSGADQTFTVPAGAISLNVRAWGAGEAAEAALVAGLVAPAAPAAALAAVAGSQPET